MTSQNHKYQQEVFPTFMLSDGAYITFPFTTVNVKVIPNNQNYVLTRKIPLNENNPQGIFPKCMFAFFVIIYSFGA